MQKIVLSTIAAVAIGAITSSGLFLSPVIALAGDHTTTSTGEKSCPGSKSCPGGESCPNEKKCGSGDKTDGEGSSACGSTTCGGSN